MTQKLDFFLQELALWQSDVIRLLIEFGKYAIKVFQVFFLCLTEDHHVVHIHNSELFTSLQNSSHSPLESGWSVLQTKRHYTPFPMSVSRNLLWQSERREFSGFGSKCDLVEPRSRDRSY